MSLLCNLKNQKMTVICALHENEQKDPCAICAKQETSDFDKMSVPDIIPYTREQLQFYQSNVCMIDDINNIGNKHTCPRLLYMNKYNEFEIKHQLNQRELYEIFWSNNKVKVFYACKFNNLTEFFDVGSKIIEYMQELLKQLIRDATNLSPLISFECDEYRHKINCLIIFQGYSFLNAFALRDFHNEIEKNFNIHKSIAIITYHKCYVPNPFSVGFSFSWYDLKNYLHYYISPQIKTDVEILSLLKRIYIGYTLTSRNLLVSNYSNFIITINENQKNPRKELLEIKTALQSLKNLPDGPNDNMMKFLVKKLFHFEKSPWMFSIVAELMKSKNFALVHDNDPVEYVDLDEILSIIQIMASVPKEGIERSFFDMHERRGIVFNCIQDNIGLFMQTTIIDKKTLRVRLVCPCSLKITGIDCLVKVITPQQLDKHCFSTYEITYDNNFFKLRFIPFYLE